jgi:DNA helicase-2/ATP-dependent DNA helicase PcrA
MNPDMTIPVNPQQARVAASRDPKAVVLAGAGTGKTTTCVAWVASLLASGVAPHEILMLTYTRKAAAEMLKRVTPFLPPKADGTASRIAAGTYHLVASKLIRHDHQGFGITDSRFITLDDEGTTSLWQNAFKSRGIMPRQEKYIARELKEIISYGVNTRANIPAVLVERYGEEDGDLYLRIWEGYRNLKREVRGLDFDDLLEYLLLRLQKDPDYAEALRGRWRYVLVDEAQDNNQLQFAIMDAFAPEHLLLVGDLNQSIYAFRGANHRLMQNFVESAGTVTYPLSLNYRSMQNILDLANAVISDQPHSVLLEAARPGHGKILAIPSPTLEAEATGVADWMAEQVRAGLPPEEIAVIARSSRTLLALESVLRQRGMAYRKYGGVSIADASEVKDFLSVLRLTFAPKDRMALMRALMMFPGLAEIGAKAWIDKDAASASGEGGLFSMGTSYPKQAKDLGVWLSHLGENKPAGEAGAYLLSKIKPLLATNYPKDHKDRLERLQVLVGSMRETEMDLPEFVDSFTLSPDTGGEHPEGHFTLSTIHSIKGLEFDAVNIMGLSDLNMPSPRSRHSDDALAEERRLLYVALTRARKFLRLSLARTEPSQKGFGQPTEFLPPDLVTWKGAGAGQRLDYQYSQESGYGD